MITREERASANLVRKKKPRLSDEEERVLIRQYQETGDESAIEKILHAHDPFCRKKADYHDLETRVGFDDLMQEARMGIILAVRNFSEAPDVRLLTYADHWIRREMYRFYSPNRTIQTVPKRSLSEDRKILKKNDKLMEEWKKSRGAEPITREEIEEFENMLGSTISEIVELRALCYQSPLSLDTQVTDPDGCDLTHLDLLLDDRQNALDRLCEGSKTILLRKLFGKANLTDREKKVLEMRYMDKHGEVRTLEDIGQEMGGVSREYIRQVEAGALKKLRSLAQTEPELQYG